MGRFKPDHETQLIVDRIVERKRPHKIILFGSRGRGTARPDSDIDLCVLYQNLGGA
jgi:predicted nucleotidyltransferase